MKEEKLFSHQRKERKRRQKNYSVLIIHAIFLFLIAICFKIQKVEASQIKLKIVLTSGDALKQKIMNVIDTQEYLKPSSVIVNDVETSGFQEEYDLRVGENTIVFKFNPETKSCQEMFYLAKTRILTLHISLLLIISHPPCRKNTPYGVSDV